MFFYKNRLSSQQLCDVGRRGSPRIQRGLAISSGSHSKSAIDSVPVLTEVVGSVAAVGAPSLGLTARFTALGFRILLLPPLY